MLWTKKSSGKVGHTATGRVLALLLSLCSLLFFSSPASATTGYWVLNSNSGYLGFENAGNKSFTFQNDSYSVVSFTNTSPDSLWGAFFVVPNATTVSVTKNDDFFMSFAMVWSNPNQQNLGIESLAKSCFAANSQYYAIDDCQVQTDVGYNWVGDSRYTENYIYSIHGHFTQNFGWLPSVNLRFRSAGLLASSTNAINVYVTAPVINIYENREVAADQLVAQRVSELKQQVFELQGIVSQISQNSNTQAIVDELEEQNDKDDEDRDNLQDQQEATQDAADDVSDDVSSATSSLSQNISTIIGAFSTNATDCLISVTTGANGVLQLSNMNVCSLPTEMHNLIHIVAAVIITIAVLFISFNLINEVITLIVNLAGGINGRTWV